MFVHWKVWNFKICGICAYVQINCNPMSNNSYVQNLSTAVLCKLAISCGWCQDCTGPCKVFSNVSCYCTYIIVHNISIHKVWKNRGRWLLCAICELFNNVYLFPIKVVLVACSFSFFVLITCFTTHKFPLCHHLPAHKNPASYAG